MPRRAAALLALATLATTALAADAARLLDWRPLSAAKVGDTARYTGSIADATGRVVDTYPVVVSLAALDADEARLTVKQRETSKERSLAPDADAAAILDALRVLPPGVTGEGAKSARVKARLRGRDVDATRITLDAAIAGGAAHVKIDALFAREAPLLGLIKSTTTIDGGGAGISTLELSDPK